jgi:arsenate reductase
MFSNTFAGIAPSSVPVFLAAQIGGGIAGVAIIRILYPALTPGEAAGVVVPHDAADGQQALAGLAQADGGRPAPAGLD